MEEKTNIPAAVQKIINEIPASAISPVARETPIEKIYHLTNDARLFWSAIDPKYVNSFEKGVILAKMGTGKEDEVQEFFIRLTNTYKEAFRQLLAGSGKTSEELKDHYQMIELAFKFLIESVKDNKMDVRFVLANFQGFVNSYLESLSKD